MTFDELLRTDYRFPTVAIFYGLACAPCERLKPALREVCKEQGLRLEEFNAANEMEAIRQLHLHSVPAVFVVWKGEPRLAFTGLVDKATIREKLGHAGAGLR